MFGIGRSLTNGGEPERAGWIEGSTTAASPPPSSACGAAFTNISIQTGLGDEQSYRINNYTRAKAEEILSPEAQRYEFRDRNSRQLVNPAHALGAS
jgi:hypothetical protein